MLSTYPYTADRYVLTHASQPVAPVVRTRVYTRYVPTYVASPARVGRLIGSNERRSRRDGFSILFCRQEWSRLRLILIVVWRFRPRAFRRSFSRPTSRSAVSTDDGAARPKIFEILIRRLHGGIMANPTTSGAEPRGVPGDRVERVYRIYFSS